MMRLTTIILLLAIIIPAPALAFEVITLDEDVYALEEPVTISFLKEPETLRIEGPAGSYRYLGAPRDPLVYIPKQPGDYTISATVDGVVEEKRFVVENRSYNTTREPAGAHEGLNPLVTINDDQGRVLLSKRQATLDESPAYQALKNAPGLVDATFEAEPFTLSVRGADPAKLSLRANKPAPSAVAAIPGKRVQASYALDPSMMSFENGTLERTAQGSELYKCASWLYDEQRCPDGWKKIMDLSVGAEYSIPITPQDPAFVETGVATVNAKKPVYEPGAEASIMMAVLDSSGFLVKDANISLTITSPSGDSQEYSTVDGTISTVSDGIYQATHVSSEEGVHDLFVTASSAGVDTAMRSNYTVLQSYPLDIQRETPMSIDPWQGSYKTTIGVFEKAESPARVTLEERVPEEFTITDPGGALVREEDGMTILEWDLPLGGEASYHAQAPRITPDLYALGPATVSYNVSGVERSYEEARPWWLAIDPENALEPIVSANTALDGVGLSSAEVSDLSSDDANTITVGKNSILTADLNDPANSTPIASVSSLDCSVTYSSEAYSPDATFRVDDAFGGTALGSTTLPPSTGGDNTVTLSNLHESGAFSIADLTTLNIYIENNDGARPDELFVDYARCLVEYEEADVQAPTINLEGPADGIVVGSSSVEFNYTPSDDRDFSSCELYIDDSLETVNSTPIINGSLNTFQSTLSDGLYDWRVECTDGSSNTGSSPTRSLSVDTTAPAAFNLQSPEDGVVSTDLTPLFSWDATSDETFFNYTLVLDDDPSFETPEYTRSLTGGVGNNSYEFSTIISSNTQYYWRVTAYDEAGFATESAQTFTYTTDTATPASFDLTSPGSGVVSDDRTPLLEWEDSADTNFKNYTVEFDDASDFSSVDHEYAVVGGASASEHQISSEPLGADTLFYWRVTAYDDAGQSSVSDSVFTYETDNTGPAITLENPEDAYVELVSNTIAFNYSVTDAASTVSSCELVVNDTSEQTDGSITQGVTQSFNQFFDNGFYEWWLNCTDANGNEAESDHRTLTVNVTTDSTPPNIILESPPEDSYVATSTIAFNYTPQDASTIQNCTLLLDGVMNSSNSTPITKGSLNTIAVSGLSQGVHPWAVSCFDESGNEGLSDERNVSVDTITPAEFSLLEPANETLTADDTPLLSWNSSSDNNFSNYTVELSFDPSFSALEYVAMTSDASDTNVTTSALSDGLYYWRVSAFDLAGNSVLTTSRTLRVDTTPPFLENQTVTPLNGSEYNPNVEYAFAIDASDLRLDAIVLDHNFDGALMNSSATLVDGNTYSYDRTGLPAGLYSYKWYANDTLGNTNDTSAESYSVLKNTTAMTLLFDGSSGDLTINESEVVNLTGVLSWPSSGAVSLSENGSVLNESAGRVMSLRNFTTPGAFLINASYDGDSNYHTSSDAHTITVLDRYDPLVTLVEPANASVDSDGAVSFGYQVSDTNGVANCTLYVDGVSNGTRADPETGSTLYFSRAYPQDRNLTWQVGCVDHSGREGLSAEYDLEVMINRFTNDLTPITCSDQDGCTASNMNVSDATFEEHGSLQKDPGTNYVYANLTSTSMPAGSTILNATFLWDKYQGTGDGTFYLYWRNGSEWEQACSQVLTSSSTAQTDPLACTLDSLPNRTSFNDGLEVRANFFYSGNPGGVAFGTDYVEVSVTYQEDETDPSVVLEDPDDGVERGAGLVEFNITASDARLDNCTLYGDFGGSWSENSTIVVGGALFDDVKSSFPALNLGVGSYSWNALCVDVAGNSAFASQNFTLNITPPDLRVEEDDIVFPQGVREGESVVVNATVENVGFTAAEDFVVRFYDGDPDVDGVQIGSDALISSLAFEEQAVVNVSYTALIGPNPLFVVVDDDDGVVESDESNNKAGRVFDVSAYHRLYGNTTRQITLDASGASTFLNFSSNTNSTGTLFFVRSGADVSFSDLVPLGKTLGGENTTDDFSDADALLNMSGFNDSVDALWAGGTDRPLNTTSLVIEQNVVEGVPYIASDDDGDFITGIMWDSSDDASSNLEYDQSDAEDLVFVANSEEGRLGSFGTYDYEAYIPARLREYAGDPSQPIEVYFELG